MKVSLVTLSFAIVAGALGHIETEFRDDGSISRVMSIPDHDVSRGMSSRELHQAQEVAAENKAQKRKKCHHKSRKSTSPKSTKDGSGKANRAQDDDHHPHRRCVKCVIKPPPVIEQPTCKPPGGRCTIDDFAKVCCPNKVGARGCYFPTGDPRRGVCTQ